MPGAGFYPIGSSRIVFGRDGNWYADGERITNRRIALLFSRHLVALPDGTYNLVMGDEKAVVEIEDTPWVVTGIEGDCQRGFVLTLNDQTQEPLDPSSLTIGPDNAFSCSVKGGTARARFLRSTHHALAHNARPTGERGRFVIEIAGHPYLLTGAGAGDRRR